MMLSCHVMLLESHLVTSLNLAPSDGHSMTIFGQLGFGLQLFFEFQQAVGSFQRSWLWLLVG